TGTQPRASCQSCYHGRITTHLDSLFYYPLYSCSSTHHCWQCLCTCNLSRLSALCNLCALIHPDVSGDYYRHKCWYIPAHATGHPAVHWHRCINLLLCTTDRPGCPGGNQSSIAWDYSQSVPCIRIGGSCHRDALALHIQMERLD